MVVVEPSAFSSEAVDDIAALSITASSKPMNPLGKLFKMKCMKT
ncbi:MAG: Uncharacterised protein [Flavobacteriaceae bacterium]|nr:MAG: Uncharacterised protein [Flavobacteriaceae bacterium]